MVNQKITLPLPAHVVAREAWFFFIKNLGPFIHFIWLPLSLCLFIKSPFVAPFINVVWCEVIEQFLDILWVLQWIQYYANPQTQKTEGSFYFGKASLLYFGYSLFFSLPFIFFQNINFFQPYAVGLYMLGALCILVLLVRVQFIFPSIALKNSTDLINAWKQSKGYGWPLLKAYGLILGAFYGALLLVLTLVAGGAFIFWNIDLFFFTGSFSRLPFILLSTLKEISLFCVEALILSVTTRYYLAATSK